jgi:hypothetical protein
MQFETKESKQAKQAAQLKERQAEQISVANGEKDAEYVEGNRRAGSKIRKHEADGYVHVEVLNKNLQPDQKSFKEDKSVVKIHAREFDRRVEEGAFSTYDQAEVIHDPRQNAPRSYSLKPENLQIDAGGPKADKNIALREQNLKNKEQALAQKADELNQSWKRKPRRSRKNRKSSTRYSRTTKRKAPSSRNLSQKQRRSSDRLLLQDLPLRSRLR